IDRLRTTAESHHRAAVVEVMGRNAGWIALHSGMAGGANAILIPERPFAVDRVCQWVVRCLARDDAAIVVVAEGAVPEGGAERLATAEVDAFGHKRLGGVGNWLADEIARRTGAESRAVVLGHIQRGGKPTAYDRVLATRFGVHAIDAVQEGDGGVMVALRGTDIVRVKLAEATATVKTVPQGRYAEAEVFFG
ncbi:MAG: 6-phosphofructokinase, partial [Pseudonocardiaceae bacterium]